MGNLMHFSRLQFDRFFRLSPQSRGLQSEKFQREFGHHKDSGRREITGSCQIVQRSETLVVINFPLNFYIVAWKTWARSVEAASMISGSSSSTILMDKLEQLIDSLKADRLRKSMRKIYYSIWRTFNKFFLQLDRKLGRKNHTFHRLLD